MNARWLTEEQRKVAMQRPQAVQKSFKSTKWQKDQFIEALIDPKTWLLAVYNVAICVPNGGITNVSTLCAVPSVLSRKAGWTFAELRR